MNLSRLLKYSLTKDEFRDINHALKKASRRKYSEKKIAKYMDHCKGSDIIPDTVKNIVKEFAENADTYSVLLLKNLPVENVVVGFEKKTSLAELALLSLANLLGKPMGCATKSGGAIIQSLIPTREDAYKQISSGSTKLIFHTEDAHLKYNCDFIALNCIRGDINANTTACYINIKDLSSHLLDELSKDNFLLEADESFKSSDKLSTRVVSYLDSKPLIRYEPIYVEYKTKEARKSMTDLGKYVEKNYFQLNLQKGDLLIINNRNSVHGRSKFWPKYDGTDRWVIRTNIFTKKIPISIISSENPYVMNV